MAISTFPQFFFDIEITVDNQNINFDEGAGELTAVLPIRSYSASEIVAQLKVSLDAASTDPLVYTVTLNRSTRQIIISSTANFDLLTNTGSQVGTSPWTLLGFDITVDHLGAMTYTGESGLGSLYTCQFPPQDYIAPGFRENEIQPSVNEAAEGDLEIISFGTRKFTSFELLFITNRDLGDKKFFFNPNGVDNALDWLRVAVKRSLMEFMPDRLDPNTFFKVQLDRTDESSNGTGFELKEETARSLPEFYRTGILTFRIVE